MKIDPVNIVIRKTQPLPLGVARTSGGVRFSFAGYGAVTGAVYIYERGSEEPSLVMELTNDYGNSTVFSCEIVPADNIGQGDEVISGKKLWKLLTDGYEYELRLDNNAWLDPYALKLYGREKFGMRECRPRCGFDLTEYDWKDKERIHRPFNENIIYELHVRGFTKHKSSGVQNKGTYSGLVDKIPYIKELGMNAVMLLPTYEFDEIIRCGMVFGMPRNMSIHKGCDINTNGVERINYWGYTPNCFYFAPKSSYASRPEQCTGEFRDMVRQFHCSGIEVFMDMHFPVVCDQALILDCLRHWVLDYHIDGFRINKNAVSEQLVRNDSVIGGVKLIASDWVSEDGKRSENAFPNSLNTTSVMVNQLAECNDSYMITVRRLLKGDENQLADFAGLFQRGFAKICNINYVAGLNGFTLMDAVSYEQKHNRDNGENNADGTDYNYSWNCGAEGPTRRKSVVLLRNTQVRNALTLLFMSAGIPLLCAGDENGNTQKGNNNAYCQDNEISWLNWNSRKQSGKLGDNVAFVRKLVDIRSSMVQPGEISFHGLQAWSPDYHPYSRMLGIMLHKSGRYIAVNMHSCDQLFELPRVKDGKNWKVDILTGGSEITELGADKETGRMTQTFDDVMKYTVKARTIAVFYRG